MTHEKQAWYSHIPLYEHNVFYSNDKDKALELINAYYPEGVDTSAIEEVTNFSGFLAPIMHKDDPENELAHLLLVNELDDWNTVGHELAHLLNHIFCKVAIPLNIADDEAQAHLAGYLLADYCEKALGLAIVKTELTIEERYSE